MSEDTTAATVAEQQHQAAVDAEYGVYVAVEPIDIGGARAFNAGDSVPTSHIERGVVSDGQVAKITTKAGRVAAGLDESKG